MGFLFGAPDPFSAAAFAELGSIGIMEGSLIPSGGLAGALVGGAEAFVPEAGGGLLADAGDFIGGAFTKFGQKFVDDPIGSGLATLGAVSALAGGFRGAQAAEFEAAQFREEMEIARVAAEQEEVQRRRQLRATLAAQTAIRAGRGVELFGSGSFEAIRKRTIEEAEEDITTAKLNALSRSRRFSLAAAEAESRGQSAILGGVGTAATAFAKGTRS